MPIEDEVEGILKDESAQAKAVSSLIDVKDRVNNKIGSDIELKTDLDTEKEVCNHTVVDLINVALSLDDNDANSHLISEDLVTIKERKLLSKGRKSRMEIVEISRQPDMNMMGDNQNQGFMKRLFTSRKQIPPPQ